MDCRRSLSLSLPLPECIVVDLHVREKVFDKFMRTVAVKEKQAYI